MLREGPGRAPGGDQSDSALAGSIRRQTLTVAARITIVDGGYTRTPQVMAGPKILIPCVRRSKTAPEGAVVVSGDRCCGHQKGIKSSSNAAACCGAGR